MNNEIAITYDSCYRGRIEIHTVIATGEVIYYSIIR